MELVASGKVAIPANKLHTALSPEGVGLNCRTKINVNLGVSPEHNNHEEELQKVQNAIDMKAEAIMDLSNFGKTREFRRKLVKMSTAMIGTVHEDAHHFVQMTTGFGGRRIVDWLSGEQLPRIC